MKELNERLEEIRTYMKVNFGFFNERKFISSDLFKFHMFTASKVVMKVSFEKCAAQFEFNGYDDNVISSTVDWFKRDVLGIMLMSVSFHVWDTSFGAYKTATISWDEDNNGIWDDVINSLNKDDLFTLTKGGVQSIHGSAKYPALCSKASTYMIIFDSNTTITIWGIEARSFEEASNLVRLIVENIVGATNNFVKYDYNFVNCISGYNVQVKFTARN